MCPGPLSSEPKWGFLLPVVIFPASFAALKGFLLSEEHLKNWQPCEERLHFVYLCVNEQLRWTLKPHFHAETHLCHMLTVCS